MRPARAAVCRGDACLTCGSGLHSRGAMVNAMAAAAGGKRRLIPMRAPAERQCVRWNGRQRRSQSDQQRQYYGENSSHPALSYTKGRAALSGSCIIGKTRIPEWAKPKLHNLQRKLPCLNSLHLLLHLRFQPPRAPSRSLSLALEPSAVRSRASWLSLLPQGSS